MGKGDQIKNANEELGFKQLDISFMLPLKPYYLRNLEDGVNAEMASHLLKYVPEFEGVLLSWWDIRFPDPSKTAAIIWEFPDVHVKVAMRLLIFSPSKNQEIRGVVNSVGKDYISLSVFKTWKAHIHQTDIPKAYRNVDIREGDELKFKVKELQLDQNVLSLLGSLTGVDVSSQKALMNREKEADDEEKEEEKASEEEVKETKKSKKEETPKKDKVKLEKEKEESTKTKKRKREDSEEEKPASKKSKKEKV